MRIASKLIRLVRSVVLLAMLSIAFPSIAVSPIAFDGQVQPINLYDGTPVPTFYYDSASTLIANDNENRTVGRSGVFADFPGFLAAEGRSLWDASRASRGFKSFDDLKRFLGSAGEGNQWHHIVEQNEFNVNKFGAEAIHNVDNVVPISAELNSKLNAFYQTKNPLTGGLAPREWLQGKSLQQNYDFGRVALDYVSRGIW